MYLVLDNPLDKLAQLRMSPDAEEDPFLKKLQAVIAQLEKLEIKTSGVAPSPG